MESGHTVRQSWLADEVEIDNSTYDALIGPNVAPDGIWAMSDRAYPSQTGNRRWGAGKWTSTLPDNFWKNLTA
ncbi:hypothetical protein PG995_014335 [Apiospora arundinis]